MRWLIAEGVPVARVSKPGQRWGYSSVNVLMRNPTLAGMFPINLRDGYGPNGGPQVRLDSDGRPVMAGDGIISVEQYERLLHAINHKEHHSARKPRPRPGTSPLLARLVACSACGAFLNRHQGGGKANLYCRHCGQTVSMTALVDLIVQRLLIERGTRRMYRRTVVVPDDPAASHRLAGIEHALRSAAMALD
jgi:hypothetical protein